MKVDHVRDITPASPRVFIKTAGVCRCKDLANLIRPLSTVSPGLRMNLAGARAYVRRKMIEHERQWALQSRVFETAFSEFRRPIRIPFDEIACF